MKLTTERVPTVVVLSATGGSEAGDESLISGAVRELVEQGVRRIVLDLTEVVRISEEHIADMIVAHLEATKQNAEFVLVVPPELLAVPPGPHAVFRMFASRGEAVQALVLGDEADRIEARRKREANSWVYEIAKQRSRRASLLFRLAYIVFLLAGLMLLTALLY